MGEQFELDLQPPQSQERTFEEICRGASQRVVQQQQTDYYRWASATTGTGTEPVTSNWFYDGYQMRQPGQRGF